MSAVRKKKLRKAMMEDVMVVDIATWHKMGKEQRDNAVKIENLQCVEGNLRDELRAKEEQFAEARQTIIELRGDNHHLEKVIKDLEERLKFEGRRSAEALSAFDSVARACDSAALVSMKMVRLMDDLDLEFTIKPKKEEQRRR